MNKPRILIVRLDRIGDVMLSTPVIKAVREAYPESHIAFMVRPYTLQIVEGNPYLNEVIVYDKDGREKSLAGNINFISGLRKKRFDLALILHPTTRTHLVIFLAGIPRRVGYDKKWGFLLTERIPHTKQFGLRHELDYNLEVLRHIGIEPKDRALYMPKNAASEERISAVFESSGIKAADRVVTINPGASCPSKRWDARRFAKVADALAGKYGAKIIVIAGESDKACGDDLTSHMSQQCVNLSGRTDIGDIASILRRTSLFISNDSGPVHIACATGTPVIAIFGRNERGLSPERWGPTGKDDVVLHKDVGCETCLAHNCRIGFKCLDAITVEDVLVAAQKILGK